MIVALRVREVFRIVKLQKNAQILEIANCVSKVDRDCIDLSSLPKSITNILVEKNSIRT